MDSGFLYHEDNEFPISECHASDVLGRTFVLDKENLQREQKDGVPGVLALGAYIATDITTERMTA